MSLTLLANIKGELYMSADYRRSIEINGSHYAVANDTIKMIYNKDKIVFGGGQCDLYTAAFKKLVELIDFTIDDITNVCRSIVPFDPDRQIKPRDNIGLVLIVGTIENGTPYYYQFSPINNFEPIKKELTGYRFFGCIEEDEQSVYDWLYAYRGSVEDLYRDFYYKYQDENIGGYFALNGIDSKGVFDVVQEKIPEKNGIKWVNLMVNGTAEVYCKSNGNIYADNLDDYGIKARKIDSSAVTTSKIEDDAVTPQKLDRLYAEYGEFKSLKADVANIEDLVATKFKATDASINNLNTSVANIKNLTAGLTYIDIGRAGTISATGIYSSGTLSGNSLFIGGQKYERKYMKDLDMYVLASRD